MKMVSITFMLILLVLPAGLYGQEDAGKILDAVIVKYKRVNDYQADVHIVADIPFIKILPMNARIYFRQPGKMRLVSKGIAILPRQGFDQMYQAITDRSSYTLVSQGNEMLEKINASVVSILPLSDTMDIITGKFWIDTNRDVILRSQITTRTNGTVIAGYSYGTMVSYGLPDRMTFTVDVRKFKVPKAIAADLNNYNKDRQKKESDGKKGRINISLSKYIINKGVPESVFNQEK